MTLVIVVARLVKHISVYITQVFQIVQSVLRGVLYPEVHVNGNGKKSLHKVEGDAVAAQSH